VDREQRGHGGEGGAEQDRAAVAGAHAADGQGDRGGGRDERPGGDQPEVDVGADPRLAAADVVQERGQPDRPRGEQREQPP
jgi:hypothetical protein